MRDPQGEKQLKELNFKFEFRPDFEIEKINVQSRHQVRVMGREKVDTVLVNDFAAAKSNGADFPGIWIFFLGGQYILGHGFHRVEAHIKAGKKVVDAYVIPVRNKEDMKILRDVANVPSKTNPFPREYWLAKAAEDVGKGSTVEQASQDYAVEAKDVLSYVNDQKVIHTMGFHPEHLNQTARRAIGMIRNKPTLRRFAELAEETGKKVRVPATAIQSYAAKINEYLNEGDTSAVSQLLDKFKREFERAGRRKQKKKEGYSVTTTVRKIESFGIFLSKPTLLRQLEDAERAEILKVLVKFDKVFKRFLSEAERGF